MDSPHACMNGSNVQLLLLHVKLQNIQVRTRERETGQNLRLFSQETLPPSTCVRGDREVPAAGRRGFAFANKIKHFDKTKPSLHNSTAVTLQ